MNTNNRPETSPASNRRTGWLRRHQTLAGLIVALAAPLAALAQQQLYLSYPFQSSFVTYDLSNNSSSTTVPNPGTAVWGLATSGSSVYAGVGSQVNQYSTAGGSLLAQGVVTGVTGQQGLAVGNNRLFVGIDLDGGTTGAVKAYDLSSPLSPLFTISGIGAAYSVSLLGSTLFVTNGNTKVSAYSAIDGSLINSDFATGLTYAGALTAMGDSVYVVNNASVTGGSDSIRRYNASNGTLTSEYTFASTFNNLLGITNDGSSLYVIRNNIGGGLVASFTSNLDVINLQLLSGLGQGISGPNFIAVTAVPEPSTYAAIFGAVGLVGAVIYRRRQQKSLSS